MAILQNFNENRKTKRFDVAVPAQVTSFEFSELVRVHDLSRGGSAFPVRVLYHSIKLFILNSTSPN